MTVIPSTPWRLLHTPPATGAWNMAVDEAILEFAARGAVPPTLRLYAWNPPCLSLGYAQKLEDVDFARLQARGWQVVRRTTGGRAILHTDELTYSVCGMAEHPILAGGVLESYQKLARALLTALQSLQAPAQSQAAPLLAAGQDPRGPVCFEVPSNYEITVNGKKLVGSAQARKLGGVLQHGTLPLTGDLTRITQVLAFPDEDTRQQAAQRLLAHADTLESACGRAVTWDEAASAMRYGFEAALGITFEVGALTEAEQARAQQLAVSKEQ